MSQFTRLFELHNITSARLPQLRDDDLMAMGVVDLEDRRRILLACVGDTKVPGVLLRARLCGVCVCVCVKPHPSARVP